MCVCNMVTLPTPWYILAKANIRTYHYVDGGVFKFPGMFLLFFKQNICCWGSGEQFLAGWWCFRLFVSKSKRFLCVSLAFGVGRYFDRFTPSWFMALAGFILDHTSSLF